MKIRLACLLSVIVVLFFTIPSSRCQQPPQTTATEQFEIMLRGLVANIQQVGTEEARANAFDFKQNLLLIALALTARSDEAKQKTLTKSVFLTDIEAARVDEQVGGSDANAGSTSLATKGSVPAILGFAVENGALTRSSSGTTVTFRGNPVGIIQAFRKEGYIKSYCDDCPETKFLRRFSFAVSFDANRGQMPGAFSGDLQQLSSYSVHLDIVNKRDPRNKAYLARWSALTNTNSQTVANGLAAIAALFLRDRALIEWNETAKRAIAKAADPDIEVQIRKQLNDLSTLKLSGEVEAAINSFSTEFDQYLQNRDQILALVARGTILTFEYTGIRQVNQPDLSNFKLVAEGSLYKGKVDLTGNASFTILNSQPSGMNLKRVRDFQFSAQIDVPLGPVQKIGAFVFTMSGKYQRMMDDAMAPTGTMVANTKGDIAIGQFKLTIPAKGTGVKIPISLTIANRTELIKESDVRGNIGITFDLDSIFAKLKP